MARHTAAVMLRFSTIENRIERMNDCYEHAANEYRYKGECFLVYPIKVNQMQPVVHEIVSHGKKFNIGLEAGSKPELHAVIAVNQEPDSIIICNGYKDEAYIELALLAQKMGKHIYIVAEKLNELELIRKWSERLGVRRTSASASSWHSVGSGQVGRVGRRCVEVRT